MIVIINKIDTHIQALGFGGGVRGVGKGSITGVGIGVGPIGVGPLNAWVCIKFLSIGKSKFLEDINNISRDSKKKLMIKMMKMVTKCC